MIDILRYTPDLKSEWDRIISQSRNGTFLFFRDYMEYHSNRYLDYSFMIKKNGKYEAVIPGNIKDNIFHSHQGLTYGGVVSTTKIAAIDMLEIFRLLNNELSAFGIIEVIYKPVPLIYHSFPSQEDIYCLFKLGAKKEACFLSSAIFQKNKIKFTESRKSGIRKGIQCKLRIKETDRFDLFWPVLNANLEKQHNLKPTHSQEEMEYLFSRFPENIKLHIAEFENRIVSGALLYLSENVAHVQYIASNNEGRDKSALDLLFEFLINEKYAKIPIFDFGHSCEQMGIYLNKNLIFQKEGFGGRGIVYEVYKYCP